MKIRVPLPLLLSVGVILGVLLGCSSDPATPTATSAPAHQPAAVVATAENVSKATEAVVVAESEPKAEVVKVGYDVGLRAPEFGMSLVDGSRVTSSSLSEEGRPVVLYFHANF